MTLSCSFLNSLCPIHHSASSRQVLQTPLSTGSVTSTPGYQPGSQNPSLTLAHLPLCSRARPVVQINASLHFEPSKINIFHKDCKRNGRDATCLAAFLCFVPIFLAPHFQTATVGKLASLGG